MADMEPLPHLRLPHKAGTLAPRPEPSLDTYPLHRDNNLLPAKHPPNNRLAQLRLDNPSWDQRRKAPLRHNIKILRSIPRSLGAYSLFHSNTCHGKTAP